MPIEAKIDASIGKSKYISRDLSWIQFNYRVLDQAISPDRTIFERLKFLAITASNLDEFFMVRVGSLYNYLDYGRERIDYSGLREKPFKKRLLQESKLFCQSQHRCFTQTLAPQFRRNGFRIVQDIDSLSAGDKEKLHDFFESSVYPMLTPMVYDSYHAFPTLMNSLMIFGVVTTVHNETDEEQDRQNRSVKKKLSFVQIPQNLPKFYEIDRNDEILFVPIQSIIRRYLQNLFRNVNILSVSMFRITRNGDFTLEESDDIDANFLEELKQKIKTRKTGRVVRLEVKEGYDEWMMQLLTERWNITMENVFEVSQAALMDYTALWQIVNHTDFKGRIPDTLPSEPPLAYPNESDNIFEVLKQRDVLLHHPYNDFEPVLELIEEAAEDPSVLSIKLTIYRLARDSRITNALLKAAENGKHVSALFELKARFDEENNIKESQRLQKAGCFVIYGISNLKTHTKLLLIVRKERKGVTRYVHMSSGNYNEKTAKLYTDLGLLSTRDEYANDVSEFFNVITGHSEPNQYKNLITAPKDMRTQLIQLIRTEARNAKQGLPSGIVIKINSLEDRETIDELYRASQAGVQIKLIVRGICCLRPGRQGLSENITVQSIVGDFLEHSRIFYFHHNDDPIVYVGSADVMVRSFDRRLESLFRILDKIVKLQVINILEYSLRDNVNSYTLQEDGSYRPDQVEPGETEFNVHQEFFKVSLEKVKQSTMKPFLSSSASDVNPSVDSGLQQQLNAIYDEFLEFVRPIVANKISNPEKLSLPVMVSASRKYTQANPKCLIVGQQSATYSERLDKIAGYDSQTLIDYYSLSLHDMMHGQVFDHFAQQLYEITNQTRDFGGYLWTNLLKISPMVDTQRVTNLPDELLAKCYELLRKEIAILRPDIIVFAPGNRFDDYIDQIYEGVTYHEVIPRFLYKMEHPDMVAQCFKTYHPSYLNAQRKMDVVVEQIAEKSEVSVT